jgi:hypothetical protein
MGFVMGSLIITIFAFVIAIVLVRPLFALLYPRRKPPGLLETFEVTAGWLAVSFAPAIIYTLIFQWAFGDALKEVTAKWFPNAPAYVEPAVAFGFIYAAVASIWALVTLSSNPVASKQ